MPDYKNKRALVIGLGGRGRAACGLLRRAGASVTGVHPIRTDALAAETADLRRAGVEVHLGTTELPEGDFDFVVVSPVVPTSSPLVREAQKRKLTVMGELELGFQAARCLSIGIAGTNGKGSVGELVERLLAKNGRKVAMAGQRARPVCDVADQTQELDFLVLQVNAFQLEWTEYFRPVVGVLTNLAPDHLDRYGSMDDYVRANARLFACQQQFDWAIVQKEALERMRALKLTPPSKVVTFSSQDSAADIYLERGLIISRLPNWPGPLLDMAHCRLQGCHNAENLMATLAVGRALRVPLERMAEVLRHAPAGAHRFELVAEVNGVQYINDSKATNVNALMMALQAARPSPGGVPNVWLIAGGRDKGVEYHDVGAILGRRAKGVFLFGEAREKLRAAWSLFTPCTVVGSLLEAVQMAAGKATSGDVVLFSPACSSFDQFRDYQHRGDSFIEAVKSTCSGV